MTRLLKTLLFGLIALLGLAPSAYADPAEAARTRADVEKTLGFLPEYVRKLPDSVVTGAWEEIKTLELGTNTALDGRTKELIGLAVSAQVPCRYCIIAHTEFAKLNGASEAELGDAVAMAAQTRKWSTVLNGFQTNEAAFRAEIAKLVQGIRQQRSAARAGARAPQRATVKLANASDGDAALRDIAATLGFVPDFLQKFPAVARGGAWKQLKDVEVLPTSISAKNKELIGLAVAAQIPCRYCVIAHTEYARAYGASETEIGEALAMASLTRGMSTLLNGLLIDEANFRRDIERIVQNARAAKQPAAQKRR